MKNTNKNIKTISVIIPVYNRTTELERAVRSVLAQTHQAFEIIVADDGSDMNIKDVCDSFNDERIRFFRNEKHINANAARNRGLKEAKGEYIAMLDSDDEFLPSHLQKRIDKIEELKCDGLFGSAYIFDGKKEKIKRSRPLRNNESMADYLLTDGFCPAPSHFYRTKAAKQILWDVNLYHNQDYDYSILFSQKFDFRCDPEPTIRIHWLKGHKQYLTNIHFYSQKKFIARHRDEISLPALINFYYSMIKEAKEIKSTEQYRYYKNELHKIASGFTVLRVIIGTRGRAAIDRMRY